MSKYVSDIFKASDYLKLKFIPMWLTLGILKLISLFPYKWQLKCGVGVGLFLKILLPKREAIIRTNLALCFPNKSVDEREKLLKENYTSLGISLIEMGMCWWWPIEKLRPMVEIKGLEHIENCLKNKQGVILLTGHFTSLEIGGRLLALFIPMQVMYRTQRNRLFDSYLYTKRDGYFVNTISRKNTRKMLKGIKKLIPTWYAPDQDFGSERNIFAPFFGVKTATITASSRLAKSSGAAMLPYFPERKKDGSGYILHIGKPLENFPSDDDLADATAINQSIETFARQFPEQYMWIHKRFKTRPEGEEHVY